MFSKGAIQDLDKIRHLSLPTGLEETEKMIIGTSATDDRWGSAEFTCDHDDDSLILEGRRRRFPRTDTLADVLQ